MWSWVRAQPDQGGAQGTERVHLQHVAAALNAPFKKRMPSILDRGSRLLEASTALMKGVLEPWAPRLLGLHCRLSPRGGGQSKYPWRPFQVAVCYLLKSGSLARTGPTPDQGTLSSWSGFRAGFGGPCKHTFSCILGGGKERVMVWALASGCGERET